MAVPPVLKRLDMFVYMRIGSPPTLVPAAATIDFYRQGATIRTAVDVPYTDPSLLNPSNPDPPPSTSVDVWHAGSILPYDSLKYDLSGMTLTAAFVDYSSLGLVRLWLWNTSAQPSLTLNVQKRLLRLNDRLIAYVDPTGMDSTGQTSAIATDPNTGRAGCYLRAFRYDLAITGTGVDPLLIPDGHGSFVLR